jgi:hypothetical protein
MKHIHALSGILTYDFTTRVVEALHREASVISTNGLAGS